MKKTNFDLYVEKKLKAQPRLKKELEGADRAWDIALQIKELRQKRGLTQNQLAKISGISQPNIARIENADYQRYSLSTLETVTKALKAKVDIVVVPDEKVKQHQKYSSRPVFSLPAFG